MEVQFTATKMPIEAFLEDLKTVRGSFDVQPGRTGKDSWGGVANTKIVGIETALVATDFRSILRTSRNIKGDHNENCFLILQRSGRALMIQEDEQTMLMPGDMMLVDSALPSEFIFFGDRSEQVSLHLERQDMMDRFGSSFQTGVAISSTDHSAVAIRAILENGLSVPGNRESDRFLKGSLFGVLGAYFFARKEGDQALASPISQHTIAPILARAIAILDARYSNPQFTVTQLAEDLSITQRQLQRAFQELSVTPTRYLLARRLEAARERIVLRSQGKNNDLISTIAFACGFSDLSYFNRRFRNAFGAAPGECSSEA